VLSVHDEGLARRLKFEARPSWSGGDVEDPNADPLVGTTLHDTYFVSRVIGEGGMGRVYEARHTRISSKRYAIKVLHAEYARNPEIRQRFQHEAEAAAAIGHPGVVGTYDVGETPGERPYMVSEYLAGEDLNEYLTEHGALPPQTVVHIGRQLCSALAAAHARGVIHRDLKPHNVFVLAEEKERSKAFEEEHLAALPSVKVLDFGLSRFVERDNDLTKTGIILGTPGYMAPEQAGGLGTDHRTDIYGLGALLYASATGRAPFKEDSPQKTVISVLSRAPTRPRELVPTIPVDLEIVIQRAMAREPSERYQSAAEVEAALARLSASSTSLDRRGRGAAGGSPRLELALLAIALLCLVVPSLGLAALSLLESRGIDYAHFRPSTLEWLLFLLLVLLLLFPIGLLLRRFYRTTWKDSARVADLLPKVRGPLIAGTLAYGISAFLVLSAWGIQSARVGSLAGSPPPGGLNWFLVLPTSALLAGSAVLIREILKKTERPWLRALGSVGYSAGSLVAGLVLLGATILGPAPPAAQVAASKAEAPRALGGRVAAIKDSKTDPPRPGMQPSTESAKPANAGVVASSEVRTRAPAGALALAESKGPDDLETLLKEYPRDGRILQALVLAHASRAETLDRSVGAIGRLFEVEPERANTPDVLFILKKGLLARGEPHKIAFEVVRSKMGSDGGELVYQLLNEQPKQADRLKKVFFELRKADKVTPATAIAFDLRYATSCRGRVALLARAERDGDLRSVHQLQALSTAPKRCGWGRKCQPLCPGEAASFKASLDIITARLDAAKKL
jgi:serine/threonine protein kinase